MRILNLDLDTLYLRSRHMNMFGQGVLSYPLGRVITPQIPSCVYFEDCGFVDDTDLLKDRYLIRRIRGLPVIVRSSYDMVEHFWTDRNLLFTSIYSPDGQCVLKEVELASNNPDYFSFIDILAGGIERDEWGRECLSLLLAVPRVMSYVIDGMNYSCSTNRLLKKPMSVRMSLHSFLYSFYIPVEKRA